MNIKRFFLQKTSLFVFIVTFWTKISVSQKLQFIIPCALPGPQKKVHISEISGQIFTNLPIMCEKKNYLNKIKLKWQNCLKQKSYRTERKFIKLREEKTCLLASWWGSIKRYKLYIFIKGSFYGMFKPLVLK